VAQVTNSKTSWSGYTTRHGSRLSLSSEKCRKSRARRARGTSPSKHPGGIAARNIAYHRHFRFADDRSHSRALSQVRVFDRCFADTPFSYQQCSSSPEHCRRSKSEEKVILAAVSLFKVTPRNAAALGRCSSPLRVLCHEYRRSTRRCVTVREMKEGPFEVGNQVLISSHRKLLSSKAMVVNVAEKSKRDFGRYD
jgi:hypothetical protein